jgi:PDZ domain-containing protein
MTNRKIMLLPKERIIAFVLLLIPLSISLVLTFPNHEEFTTTGDIVSVQELDIDGHVNFTYVDSGYTRNWFEKLSVLLTVEDHVAFVPIEPYDIDQYELMEDEGEQYRLDAIHHAVEHASNTSEQTQSEFDEKLQSIIAETEYYYGDSFGLMIAIGLIEEWNNEDFSRGNRYIIAGTGTIEADQTVGSIGAVREKLLTAEKNNVDYFLIPKDKDRYYYEGLSNEEEALMVIDEKHLNLQLIPVDTLEDALTFLRALPK